MIIDRNKHNKFITNVFQPIEIQDNNQQQNQGNTNTNSNTSTGVIGGSSNSTTIIYQGSGMSQAEKEKLQSIETGAQVNQNAFSSIIINDNGSTTQLDADQQTDVFTIKSIGPIKLQLVNDVIQISYTWPEPILNLNELLDVDSTNLLNQGILKFNTTTAKWEIADGSDLATRTWVLTQLEPYATQQYVIQQIDELIGSAPGALDTLEELAQALGDDPNFATTITNLIAGVSNRVDSVEKNITTIQGNITTIQNSISSINANISNIEGDIDTINTSITNIGADINSIDKDIETINSTIDTLPTFEDITWGNVIGKPSWIGSTKPTYNWSEIQDKPSWIGSTKPTYSWSEIQSKPTIFSTNIASITDLHSSWDTVLAAQKPNWLTTVSLATITDLHANWDTILKVAPTAYITRWPTFSEVTSKPTTLSGYGITDGVNAVSIAGSGNVVSTASISGHTLTLTKGITALTSHQTIYTLTIQVNGTDVGVFDPKDDNASINITTDELGAITVVNLATISDLHSSWDALLKAAPSAYVTRWPTAAEVGALTQATADGRYVNLSGDTMTGTLYAPKLVLTGSGTEVNYIHFGDANYTNGRILISQTDGALVIQASDSGAIRLSGRNSSELTDFNIKVSSHSVATINDSVIWTAGNDGSGSGLDADLLDGLQSTSYARAQSISHGSSSTAYTPQTYVSNYANSGYFMADRGSWYHVGNGYITSDFGNIHLSGTAVATWRYSDTVFTQLYITPYYNTASTLYNEMLFYTYQGTDASPAWTRVLTNRNYTSMLNSKYVTLDTAQTISGNKKFTGAIYMGISHYIYGINETSGGMLFFDGTRTVVGSCGATNTAATHIRSKTGHATIGASTTASYNILDTGNYTSYLDSRYVNVSGDIMTGTLVINDSSSYPLAISSTDATQTYMRVRRNGGDKAAFGYYDGKGAFMFNWACSKYLQITDGGALQFGNQTVWHAGNDGAGSGLDADLLDGIQSDKFFYKRTNPSGTAWDWNDYLVNGVYCVFTGGNWSGTNAPAGNPYPYGNLIVFNNGPSTTQLYIPHLQTTLADSRAYVKVRSAWSGSFGAWRDLAFTTSNVASATKLQTARTIFGKSFDGTANVAGQALVYGTYSAGSTKYTNGGIQIREAGLVGSAQSAAEYAPSIGFHWSGRTATNILMNSSGNIEFRRMDFTNYPTIICGDVRGEEIIAYDSDRANRVSINWRDGGSAAIYAISDDGTTYKDLVIGTTTAASGMVITAGHNVGIGTASPSYKLHVMGNIYANTGYLYSNNNGTVLQMGAQNTVACHIYNSAQYPFSFNAEVRPATDGVYTLGDSTHRWNAVYAGKGIFSGAVTMSSTLAVTGNIQASSDIILPWEGTTYSKGALLQAVLTNTPSTNTGAAEFCSLIRIDYKNEDSVVIGSVDTPIVSGASVSSLFTIWGFTSEDKQNTSSQDYSWQIYIDSKTGRAYFQHGGASFGYGIDNNNYPLFVIGNAAASGTFQNSVSSDIRLKNNVENLYGLETLRKLRPVEFDWKEEYDELLNTYTRHDYGLIAQEVDLILPNIVAHNKYDQGILGIYYDKLIPFTIAAIKEVDNEVTQLKKRIEQLENKLKEYGENNV